MVTDLKNLSDSTFKAFQTFIYDKAGIHYPDEKLGLLSNRIKTRLRRLKMDGYEGYLKILKAGQAVDELQQFLNAITTNETYFFRCEKHWDFFREWLRHKKEEGRGKRNKSLSIWSAAASNGSEAYSIVITLQEILGPDFDGYRIEILGTDLNDAVLEEARQAIYRPYALGQTPAQVQKRYFKKLSDDEFQFEPKLKRMVKFTTHNLKDPLNHARFDFIFLRNVMIYFDIPSKENVLSHMRKVLVPGGFLVVGESESLLNLNHQMTYIQPSIFMLPGEGVEVPTRLQNKRSRHSK